MTKEKIIKGDKMKYTNQNTKANPAQDGINAAKAENYRKTLIPKFLIMPADKDEFKLISGLSIKAREHIILWAMDIHSPFKMVSFGPIGLSYWNVWPDGAITFYQKA